MFAIKRLTQLLLAIAFTASVAADDLICRLPRINGFDAEYARAKPHTGAPVTELNEMRLFVTVKGDELYCQSNFVTAGAENPTKLSTNRTDLDVPNLLYNLVGSPAESGISAETFLRAVPKIPVYVDEAFLRSDKYRGLEFGDATTIFAIGRDAVPRKATRIAVGERIRWYTEFAPKLFAQSDADVARLATELQQQPFTRSDVRVLSLTTNTATNKRLAELIPAENRIEFDLSTRDRLADLMSQHQGKTVIPIGHIEGTDFVTYNAAGEIVFRLPVADLRQIAADCCQVTIFAFGCDSARASGGAGVVGKFNTLRAVDDIAAAIDARTQLEFLQRLIGNDRAHPISLVIQDFRRTPAEPTLQAKRGTDTEIAVYRGDFVQRAAATGSEPRRDATVFILHPPLPVQHASTIQPPPDLDGEDDVADEEEAKPIWPYIAGAVIFGIIVVAVRKGTTPS